MDESSRSIAVCEDKAGRVKVAVNQPGDCMQLQRDHIKNAEVQSLSVTFCNLLPKDVDDDKSPQRYRYIVRHLLETYRPSELIIQVANVHAESHVCMNVDVGGDLSYIGMWSKNKDRLTFTR